MAFKIFIHSQLKQKHISAAQEQIKSAQLEEQQPQVTSLEVLPSQTELLSLKSTTTGWRSVSVLHRTILTVKSMSFWVKHRFKHIWRMAHMRNAIIGLAIFVLLIVQSWGLVTGWFEAQALKGKVLGQSTAAVSTLQSAVQRLKNQDTAAAYSDFSAAIDQFNVIETQLQQTNIFLTGVLALAPQGKDLKTFLSVAQKITEAGQSASNAVALQRSFTLDETGIQLNGEGDSQAEALNAAITQTQHAVQLVNDSVDELKTVNPQSLPESYQATFETIIQQFPILSNALEQLNRQLIIIQALTRPHTKIALFFANYNEIRAGGGFMGTYGDVQLESGALKKLTVSSIYDLDGQLKEVTAAPFPFPSGAQLALRDTNFLADFSQNAPLLSRYYEKEGKETPDFIFMLTPQLIIDWLRLTGPITIPNYGVTFTAENFLEQAQLHSSVLYDIVENKPKKILSDFMPLLLQRLGTVQSAEKLKVVEAFYNNIQAKHIALYARDPIIQENISSLGWGGSIPKTNKDFFMPVWQNALGLKNDIAAVQEISVTTKVQTTGRIQNHVTWKRKNPLPDEYLIGGFGRILIPSGSKITEVRGLIESDQQLYYNSKILPAEPEVKNWENALRYNTEFHVIQGSEAGYDTVGFWQRLQGGAEETVEITYELPFTLASTDAYSMYVVKQLGSQSFPFKHEIIVPGAFAKEWNSAQLKNTSEGYNFTQPLNQNYLYSFLISR